MTQARSTASAPTEPLPAWARAGLWAVTGGIVVAVAVTVRPVDRSHARRGA